MALNNTTPLFVLTIPGLRKQDLATMPHVAALAAKGQQVVMDHSFPCLTWPSQTNMLTGKQPSEHGVIANGFYWREQEKVEMWTAWNDVIEQPQLWDVLKKRDNDLKTMAWFPMLSKGCNADLVCMPAPIHQPDGGEDMWCHTRPQEFYGTLLEEMGHFPLHHFWGPIAQIGSSRWIAKSAVRACTEFKPDFAYIYLPHLDYAAQKFGPDSEAAIQATRELDEVIGELCGELTDVYGDTRWLIVSEYVIEAVDHVSYPNRILREAGLLDVEIKDDGEHLNTNNSHAWCLVDHQIGHVFVKDHDRSVIAKAKDCLQRYEGIDRVLDQEEMQSLGMNHSRSGDLLLISNKNSWQAYYWWNDDALAPDFAATVDIHRKPGYDPVELFIDMPSKKTPLDATLVKGSHGIPQTNDQAVLIGSWKFTDQKRIRDTDLFELVLNSF